MSTTLIAIDLVLGLMDRAAAVTEVIKRAQSEGRDLTEAELDGFAAQDDIARKALDAAITAARSKG